MIKTFISVPNSVETAWNSGAIWWGNHPCVTNINVCTLRRDDSEWLSQMGAALYHMVNGIRPWSEKTRTSTNVCQDNRSDLLYQNTQRPSDVHILNWRLGRFFFSRMLIFQFFYYMISAMSKLTSVKYNWLVFHASRAINYETLLFPWIVKLLFLNNISWQKIHHIVFMKIKNFGSVPRVACSRMRDRAVVISNVVLALPEVLSEQICRLDQSVYL